MSTVFSDVQPNLALSSCGFFLLWMVANMATSQNWKPKKKTLLCKCKIQNRPQKQFFLDQRNERKNNQMSHVVAYVDIHVCCWITESHKSCALISNLYKRDWDLETLLPFCKPWAFQQQQQQECQHWCPPTHFHASGIFEPQETNEADVDWKCTKIWCFRDIHNVLFNSGLWMSCLLVKHQSSCTMDPIGTKVNWKRKSG